MRTIAVLLASAFVAACAPRLLFIPASTVASGIDFSSFTQRGFHFSPEAYSGDYASIGLITVAMHAEGRIVADPRYPDGRWEFAPLGVQQALGEVYQRARSMGADAVVRLSVRHTEKIVRGVVVPGIEVSGYAIRRRSAVNDSTGR